MKSSFKIITCSAIVAAITIIAGCHKDVTSTPSSSASPTGGGNNTDNYSSMSNFFAKNGVAMQTYTITGSTGGSFTTPQGTVVSIPANAFINSAHQVVTGPVTINFKDIYKKSDMLLSNMATTTFSGAPLKSGGEFYIKAIASGSAVNLAATISVKQPLNSFTLDKAMQTYVKPGSDTAGWIPGDTIGNGLTWDTVGIGNYDYLISQLEFPIDSGSWCNSDDPSYFSSYPLGTLQLQETDTANNYNTQLFLVFKSINTTDACHTYFGNDFSFTSCVPVGLQCTAVAIGIRNGKVYSSFTPITISTNQTLTFSMTETTTAAFEAQLTALN